AKKAKRQTSCTKRNGSEIPTMLSTVRKGSPTLTPASRQQTPTTIPAISAVPADRLTPTRHSSTDTALWRTTSNSPAIARTAPNEKTNVAYATLKAPRSRGPTVLATSRARAKLVALESSWSARPHPNRPIMLMAADRAEPDKLSRYEPADSIHGVPVSGTARTEGDARASCKVLILRFRST